MTKARELSDYTGLQGDLALKSPIASPSFTGTVSGADDFISTKAGGVFLKNTSGGTSATQIMVSNTGGSMRAGVESSAGQALQIGTSPYAAVFGNQGNYPTQFTTNGTTRMTIDSSGRVTMPHQPAFSVTKSVAQNNISVSGDVLVTWDTESYDVGSNFASNTFTAPVTGKYQLSMLLRINTDSAATYYRTGFDTSNRSYRFIFDPDFGQDLTYWSFALSELVDMDANDTAIINIRQVNGSEITDISGSPSSARFTGYLVA